MSGHDIEVAIKKEFSGSIEKGLLGIGKTFVLIILCCILHARFLQEY